MLPAGYLLQGRYQIIRELGQGGFAVVYLAEDRRLNGRYVAIKEFDAAKLPPSDRVWASKSFQKEAQVLSGLNHPSIASVMDFFSVTGLDYLVMEYVRGETLTQVWQRVGGRIHPDQVLLWARELCKALDYLHRQTPPIIFRDLKPDNIMVQADGRLKIIDFGIARHYKPGQTTDTVPLGTPGYAAPEQHGQGQTDARSDIYSLAAVLHQLLTGHDPTLSPMAFPNVQALSPYVPQHVAAAIQRALNLNAAQRFAQVGDFAAALGVPITGGAVPPPIPPTPSNPAPPPSRSWVWAMGGLALLVVLALGGSLVWNGQQNRESVPTAVAESPIVTVVVTAVTTASLPETVTSGTGGAGTELAIATAPVEEPSVAPTETATVTPSPTATHTPTATPLPANNRPIVFDSTRDLEQPEIYIMDHDGQNQRRLTNNTVRDDEADLSPDSQWIAFTRQSNTVWLMRVDGSEARSLVSGRAPDWSPDGRYLAYETIGDSPHIWIFDTSTGQRWQLTSGSRPYRSPDWSPDGQQIVVMSRVGSDWQIVIINVSNGAEQRITSGSGDKRFPAWSPDGRLIAYNTLDSRGWPEHVWLIEPSGNGARAITRSGNNGRPTWSPDSQYLVFNSYINSRWVLYQVDLNGQQGRQLTTIGHDQRARWSN